MISNSRTVQLFVASLGHLGRFAIVFIMCLYLRDSISVLYVCFGPAASYHSLREFGTCAFYGLVFTEFLETGTGQEGLRSMLVHYAPAGIVAVAIAIAWGKRRHRMSAPDTKSE